MLRAPVPGLWVSQCQRPTALHLPEQHSQKASAPGPRQPSLGCVFAMCGSPCSTAVLGPTHGHCAGRARVPTVLFNTGAAMPRQEAA